MRYLTLTMILIINLVAPVRFAHSGAFAPITPENVRLLERVSSIEQLSSELAVASEWHDVKFANGRSHVVQNGDFLRRYDLESGLLIEHHLCFYYCVYNRDESLLPQNNSGRVTIFDVATGAILWEVVRIQFQIRGFELMANETLLVVFFSNGTVSFYGVSK